MTKMALSLETYWHEDHLNIGIREPDDPLWSYQETPVPMDMIKVRCRELVETLNKINRKGGQGPESLERLKEAGRLLFDELLPHNIKNELSTTGADYLILNLDEHLVHIPWELLCNGEEFLCQRFSMGRLVGAQVRHQAQQKIVNSRHRDLAKKPLEMLILTDPGGDLSNADSEGIQIFQNTRLMNQKKMTIYPSLDAEITPDQIKYKIKKYDIVHFAGHADYDSENPGKSGWRLADGNFSADDIYKMAGGSAMPALVFSNACQSARTEEWKSGEDNSFGLANTFLLAGVRHYLGTSWEIMDEPSSRFAVKFYNHLFSGKTIGESVKEARLSLMDDGYDSVGWASYILYGAPWARYFGQDERIEFVPPAPIPVKNGNDLRGIAVTPLNPEDNQKNQNLLRAFLIATVLVPIVILGYIYVFKYFQIENREVIIKETYMEKKRNDQLIDSINKKTLPGESPSGHSDSAPLTIAIVYDPHQAKAGGISSAIKKEIKRKYPNIKFVERQELNALLEEANLVLSLPSENKLRLNVLASNLILQLKVDESLFQSSVEIKLLDTTEWKNIFHEVGELGSGKKLSGDISEKLLEKLGDCYQN